MEKNKNQSVSKIVPLTLSVVRISVMMCLSITAWNPPDQTPPGNNAKAPINVGDAAQGKLGNLGIGTDSPTQKLDVRGSVSIGGNAGGNTNRLYLERNDTNHYIYSTGTTGNNMYFGEWDGNFHFINTSGGTEVVTIKSGNLGIGTTAPANMKLQINDSSAPGIRLTDGSSSDWWIHGKAGGTTQRFGIYDNTASAYRFYIDNSGNVGIGTTAPQFKLSVTGTANISRDGTWECCSSGDFTLSLAENTATTGKKAGIQFHNGNAGEGQLRLDDGNDGRELKAYSYQTDMDLHATGYVQGDKGLCIGNDCCTSWAECLGGTPNPDDPYLPPSGCTDTLPAGNKKIFVTSSSYGVADVHADNYTHDMKKADDACQLKASSAGLVGTYKALIYETVLRTMNNCNDIYVLREPAHVLPAAGNLWNGQKIGGTNNCNWHLIAINGSDMFSAESDENFLRNPIKYNEKGAETIANVFTNFQPVGNGTYNKAYTCLTNSTCSYQTGGTIPQIGCYYGNSAQKNKYWAGIQKPPHEWTTDCLPPCDDAKALYCVEQ